LVALLLLAIRLFPIWSKQRYGCVLADLVNEQQYGWFECARWTVILIWLMWESVVRLGYWCVLGNLPGTIVVPFILLGYCFGADNTPFACHECAACKWPVS
jgi:hypothetical protein